MALNILRVAARSSSPLTRFTARSVPKASSIAPVTSSYALRSPFTYSAIQRSGDHGDETFEEFSHRYAKPAYKHNTCACRTIRPPYESEFDKVQDVFELQRNLNNAFAYDLVPSPGVITAALKAARRVNDYPTAVRIFEGIKAKVENNHQYNEYLEELKPIREELGINLKEDLYPEGTDSPFYNP